MTEKIEPNQDRNNLARPYEPDITKGRTSSAPPPKPTAPPPPAKPKDK